METVLCGLGCLWLMSSYLLYRSIISEMGKEGELEHDKWENRVAIEHKREGPVLCDPKSGIRSETK